MSKEWIECLEGEEAWEQRKLTSGTDDGVGVMKEPRYLALVSGMSGTSRDQMSGVVKKKGAQKGQLHCESASAVKERETRRAAWTVRSWHLDPLKRIKNRVAKCWRRCKSRQRASLVRAMRTVSWAYSMSGFVRVWRVNLPIQMENMVIVHSYISLPESNHRNHIYIYLCVCTLWAYGSKHVLRKYGQPPRSYPTILP